jgi:hypothetical protein
VRKEREMCVRGWDVSEGNAGLRDTATLERRPTQRSGTPTGRERSGTPAVSARREVASRELSS